MRATRSGAGHDEHGNRHLVHIDIENFTGTSSPTYLDLGIAELKLREVICDLDQAQCVVACSHRAAKTVAFAFPWARLLQRSGPDGADLALIEELSELRIMKRFHRVTVVSGDWRFADSLAALATEGIETTVVSWMSRLSRRLRIAARHVIALTDGETTLGEAS